MQCAASKVPKISRRGRSLSLSSFTGEGNQETKVNEERRAQRGNETRKVNARVDFLSLSLIYIRERAQSGRFENSDVLSLRKSRVSSLKISTN
jgi:hypothetical protein